MIDIILNPKEADDLQSFVYDHLVACQMSVDLDESEYEQLEIEPYDVFCGCDVCEGREIIMAVCDWFRTNRGIDIYVR